MTGFATLKRFFKDDSGATAIEYGLIAALVSVFAITALSAMGDSLAAVFDTSAEAINGVLPANE
jgi:pilus assembly protein Flp/PilA